MNRIDKWSSWIIDYCQYCFEKGFLANISKRSVTFSKRNAGHANREPLGILSTGSPRFQSPIASIRLNHIKFFFISKHVSSNKMSGNKKYHPKSAEEKQTLEQILFSNPSPIRNPQDSAHVVDLSDQVALSAQLEVMVLAASPSLSWAKWPPGQFYPSHPPLFKPTSCSVAKKLLPTSTYSLLVCPLSGLFRGGISVVPVISSCSTCPVATGSPGFHHQRLQALRPPQTATSLPRQGLWDKHPKIQNCGLD